MFQNLFKTTAAVIPEARFRLTKEFLSFRGMGLSHVDLLDATFPASDFSTYQVDENIEFGLRMEDVLKLVKAIKPEDELELSVDQDRIVIKSGRKRFTTKVVEAQLGKQEVPEIPFQGKIVMAFANLLDAFDTIAIQSETIVIDNSGDSPLLFYGEGDTGSAAIEPEVVSVEGQGKCSYNLSEIAPLLKAVVVAKGEQLNSEISFGTNQPIRISIGRINYFYAPKVNQ